MDYSSVEKVASAYEAALHKLAAKRVEPEYPMGSPSKGPKLSGRETLALGRKWLKGEDVTKATATKKPGVVTRVLRAMKAIK